MTDLHSLLDDRRREVNKRIDQILSSGLEHAEASDFVKYTFRTGGKRLRPVLLTLACEAVGGTREKALDAGVAVEFIHAASLIFDDLVDRDRIRRNLPTMHAAFADDKAISSGLFLASKGVQLLSDYKDSKIMEMIGWALVELSKGEILDVVADFTIDVDHYLTIADLKTGALFAASAGIGGIIGGGNKEQINALHNYGRYVGVAFQIKDDILDLASPNADPQKHERANLVLAHYLGETVRRERVSHIMNKTTGEEEEDPIEVLKSKAVKFAVRTSRSHIEKAKAELESVSLSEQRNALELFADFALERES
jgi:geranylgeranyl diphosphate synthase type I